MCRHACPAGGELGSGNSLAAQERAAAVASESGSVGSAVLFCVFSLSVALLFLFPLFAVLLNCPYPDPPVSASFFPFSSAPLRGEGQPCGPFVAGRSQTITVILLQTGNSHVYCTWRGRYEAFRCRSGPSSHSGGHCFWNRNAYTVIHGGLRSPGCLLKHGSRLLNRSALSGKWLVKTVLRRGAS